MGIFGLPFWSDASFGSPLDTTATLRWLASELFLDLRFLDFADLSLAFFFGLFG